VTADGAGAARSVSDGLVIRPFDAGRDEPALVELLETAFGLDMLERDRQWLVELSRLSDLAGPWLGVIARVAPPLAMSLSGFVAEEGGHVVANASLMRGRAGVWAIANVVTRQDRRRQGLARRLMTEAIDAARHGGARQLHLQVRDDNEPARCLYDSLGFRWAGAMTWLLAPSTGRLAVPSAALDGFRVARWRTSQAAAVHALIGRADPGGLATPRILHESARSGIGAALSSWLAESARYRFAASSGPALRGVGVAWASAAPGPHQLAIAVDPPWRGRVEAGLAAALLGALGRHADQSVKAELHAEEAHAIAVLEAAGFRRRRTLDRLVLDLR
jgi:ribosomal protein S18 acetylase RimI-like enzyme